MQKKEFIELSARIHDGTASEQDVIRYNAYYNQLQQQAGEPSFPEEQALLDRIHTAAGLKNKVRPLGTWLRIAAAVVVLAGAGIWFIVSRQQPAPATAMKQDIPHDAAPGGNKAYLTLADGSKIELEEAKTGQLALQNGMRITKTASGEVIYESDTSAASAKDAVSYNVLSTPRGGQFRLLLPDGSKVWLNAESSLRFPTAFNGSERSVELKGEGYFEVAKNAKQPFVVGTSGQKVTVLGTHFNIQAYPDEPGSRTTLLEGRVEVAAGGAKRLLAPGEQCRLNLESGLMRTVNVDTEEAVAWKNGYFIFNETPMKDVLKQLCRWYNVQADFSRVPNIRYSGSIPRNVPLSKVINMLAVTGGVQLKADEHTISIK